MMRNDCADLHKYAINPVITTVTCKCLHVDSRVTVDMLKRKGGPLTLLIYRAQIFVIHPWRWPTQNVSIHRLQLEELCSTVFWPCLFCAPAFVYTQFCGLYIPWNIFFFFKCKKKNNGFYWNTNYWAVFNRIINLNNLGILLEVCILLHFTVAAPVAF